MDGTPTVTERLGAHGWWWDTQHSAKYGDVAAYRDVGSDYIYVLGHPPKRFDGHFPAGQYVYQARVRARDAFDLAAYEYWWGRQTGWKPEPLAVFTPATAVMWGVGQGQLVYSAHFQAYLYVHLSACARPRRVGASLADGAADGPTVALRAAPAPEGPWSADVDIYTATPIDGGFVYAGVAYPYLDESGRTLTIAFTNNNHIQVICVAFE